ncbi:MAG: twin-arginine translocation signal domain-containing protein, partial [Burkholderiales bacterium]
MQRRDFLKSAGVASLALGTPDWAQSQDRAQSRAHYRNTLIIVELKGANDGLNSVVPYADAQYYALRPKIAIKRQEVLQLDERTGLHPSLAPLMANWNARELAIVQGLGYPTPNLSHFRSIEIWDTASN